MNPYVSRAHPASRNQRDSLGCPARAYVQPNSLPVHLPLLFALDFSSKGEYVSRNAVGSRQGPRPGFSTSIALVSIRAWTLFFAGTPFVPATVGNETKVS